jgi:hypothetical protein
MRIPRAIGQKTVRSLDCVCGTAGKPAADTTTFAAPGALQGARFRVLEHARHTKKNAPRRGGAFWILDPA